MRYPSSMKVYRYTHIGPELCAGVREGVSEALTGERTGQAIEPRK